MRRHLLVLWKSKLIIIIIIIKAAPTEIFPLRGLFEAVTRAADGEKRRRRRGEGRVKGGRGRGVEGKWWGWWGGAEGDYLIIS